MQQWDKDHDTGSLQKQIVLFSIAFFADKEKPQRFKKEPLRQNDLDLQPGDFRLTMPIRSYLTGNGLAFVKFQHSGIIQMIFR